LAAAILSVHQPTQTQIQKPDEKTDAQRACEQNGASEQENNPTT